MAVSNFKVKTVSKKELLIWFRENISPNLMSFDELGNGVDFCLGLDMVFPGVIGNRIIELTETTEYSKRLNFRRLQTALSNLNVKTDIPIDGLIKGSFKDMFAFGIWFKAFFEANCKSQPIDLNKVRASHLKKWVKRKKQYESHKTKLYLKSVKHPTSEASETHSRNKGDCDSIDTNSEKNVVSNTELTEVEPKVQTYVNTPAELLSTEVSEDILWPENVTLGKIPDISTESFTGENKHFDTLRPNDISQMTYSNVVKKVTGDSDADRRSRVDKSRTESNGNTDLNCRKNPVTDGTFAMNMTLPCLNGSSLKKVSPPVMFSEQINIELENYNIHLKESLEKLNKKYTTLCSAVNEVKETLNEMSVCPIADEPTEDQFCAIKTCCKRITKVLNDVHL